MVSQSCTRYFADNSWYRGIRESILQGRAGLEDGAGQPGGDRDPIGGGHHRGDEIKYRVVVASFGASSAVIWSIIAIVHSII